MGLFIYNKGVLFFRFVRSMFLTCLDVSIYLYFACFLSDLGHFDLILAWYVYLCLTTMRTGWKWKVSTQEWIHYTYLRLYWHIAGVLHRWIYDFCLFSVWFWPIWPNASLLGLFMPNYPEDRLVMKGIHPRMNPL